MLLCAVRVFIMATFDNVYLCIGGRRGGFDTTDLWFCYMGYLDLSLLALTRHMTVLEVYIGKCLNYKMLTVVLCLSFVLEDGR